MNDPNALYVPEYSEESIASDGELVRIPWSNDLLVSRVPNFLSKEYLNAGGDNPATWGSLVVIQATHGMGTRAAGLLLTSKGRVPLAKAMAAVSDSLAFQVHFRVSNPGIDDKNIHQFRDITYERSTVLSEKELPIGNYKLLRELILQEHGIPT